MNEQPASHASGMALFYDLQVDGVLDGRIVASLPDQGAGANFLSQAYVEQEGWLFDSDVKMLVPLANGKKVQTIGLIQLPFCFKGDNRDHILDFHILPRCVSNVILGGPFLSLTKTFTAFAHCVKRTVRNVLARRVLLLGGHQLRMGGWLNGQFTGALPDTGSDIMLLSRSYATARGFDIDDDPEYNVLLQLGDGSTAATSGRVKEITWLFGDQDGSRYGSIKMCDFCIVDDLVCDVILSSDFLHHTQAFHDFSRCEFNLSAATFSFNAIKAIELCHKKGQSKSISYPRSCTVC